MTTIHDVARVAGVGVGTVSRVINDSPAVSEQTRVRVQRVIDELGYRPSSLARALSLGRAASLAVIVPHFTRPSTVERLRGLAEAVNGSDFDLVLFDVETPEQRDQRFQMAVRSDRAAGLVIVSLAAPHEVIEQLRVGSIPVVFLDRHVDGICNVHVDDVDGGRLATDHLLSLGHRRIGFIGDDDARGFGFTSSDDRLTGYRAALAGAGSPDGDRYVRVGPSSREAARERGLAVPGDLSVIGFDDIDAAVYLGLTTVRQPLFESGRLAAELLLSLLAGDDEVKGFDLPVDLVVRKTTAPPR